MRCVKYGQVTRQRVRVRVHPRIRQNDKQITGSQDEGHETSADEVFKIGRMVQNIFEMVAIKQKCGRSNTRSLQR